MSPRAAWRLESSGFSSVYDYTPGKADWLAWGLPTEGTRADVPRLTGVVRRDVPRVRLEETVAEACAHVTDGWEVAVVCADRGVVLGTIRAEALGMDADRRVSELMQEGPSTFRPDVTTDKLAQYLRDHDMPRALVTTPDGTLVGLARLQDLAAKRPGHGEHAG